MQFRLRYAHDASLFRQHVEAFLAEREAENNLVFGIMAGIIDGLYSFSHEPALLLSVEAETGIQLVALRTPPLNLILSTARPTRRFRFQRANCAPEAINCPALPRQLARQISSRGPGVESAAPGSGANTSSGFIALSA